MGIWLDRQGMPSTQTNNTLAPSCGMGWPRAGLKEAVPGANGPEARAIVIKPGTPSYSGLAPAHFHHPEVCGHFSHEADPL